MYTHRIETKLSFVNTKERNSKGNFIKRPVVHRKMYLDGAVDCLFIEHWRIVARNRTVGKDENGDPIKNMFFSTSYIPATERPLWQTPVVHTKYVREKEPSGRVTAAYDLEGILHWLSFRVIDPVAALTELLTAVPTKATSEDDEELEEAA